MGQSLPISQGSEYEHNKYQSMGGNLPGGKTPLNRDRVKLVLRGFLDLDAEEQERFGKLVDEFRKLPSEEQKTYLKRLNAEVNFVILGPLGSACLCCGKS